MSSSLSKVRVDRAPGFTALKNKAATLEQLNIELDLGDSKNKNALAIVDKKIQELRKAIKKISPSHSVLNQMTLSKATSTVNESIRYHKLSSKEIQFSRDLATNDNLQLDDTKIAETVTQHRTDNNPYSAKSKSKTKEPACRANAVEGQLVFHKQEGDKNTRRDLYIVIDKDTDNETLTICKVRDAISNKAASMVPHDARYRYNVRQTDIILAPNQPPPPLKYDAMPTFSGPLPPHPVHQPPLQHYREVHQPHPPRKPTPCILDEGSSDDEDQEIWSIPIPRAPDPQHQHHPDTNLELDSLSEHSDSYVTIDDLHHTNSEDNGTSSEHEDNTSSNDEHFNSPNDEDLNNPDDEDLSSPDDEDPNNTNTGDNQQVEYTNSDEGSVGDDEHHAEHDNDEHYQAPPDIIDIAVPIEEVTHHSLPTRNKFIKFRRHPDCTVAADLNVPANKWSFAQILRSHKFDKYGRRWYDIKFDNEYVMGIYLSKICGGTRVNDLIWTEISEIEYHQHHGRHLHPLEQLDGQAITPETLTPESNAEIDDRPPSPAWDHLPDRLAEDGAVFWEEEPLQPLTPVQIQHEELSDRSLSTTSPEFGNIYRFARLPAVRRNQRLSRPLHLQDVQLDSTANLQSVLHPSRPILPESVILNQRQDLGPPLDVVQAHPHPNQK